MRPNKLKQLLRDGKTAANAWLSIPSSYSAEVIGHCGFDAVTIDMQHGMVDFGQAVALLQAISATPATPLARPQSSDPVQIMRLLDAGAYGVICPQVDNADIARAVVAACKYPPSGERSFGPSRGLLYGGADYFAHANQEILVLVMIESPQAVANLDSILDVPGVDGIYIGPNDFSLTHGGAPSSEPGGEVGELIERVRARTQERGLYTGIFCADGLMARRRIAQGFQVVTPGNDATILKAGCLEQLSAMGAAAGGAAGTSGY
jgi:4-hydroxy-2-oxoheptanedioate aldolase